MGNYLHFLSRCYAGVGHRRVAGIPGWFVDCPAVAEAKDVLPFGKHFGALAIEDQRQVVRLSVAMIDELLLLATLSPLAAVDLRAPFRPKLIATDASLNAMAAVEASISQDLSAELCRTSLSKGRWTTLLSPAEAWAKQHDLLSPL